MTRSPEPKKRPKTASMSDAVDLVFVTPHNFLYAFFLNRQEASDIIRGWYNIRERIKKNEANDDEVAWLAKGTFASNYQLLDGDYAHVAIGWEHVIGMYIREIDDRDLQRRAVKLMEKQIEQMEEGENWKEPDEEEDN